MLESAHDSVTASDQAGVPVLVGHHRRHSTAVRRTKQLLENHAIGALIALSLMWALKKPDDYFDVDWRSRPPGGGPVLINLIHELDTLRFLCGEIDRVYAAYPHLNDDEFVRENLAGWLACSVSADLRF